ncbi:MAG: HPF/RaiA family ribosome-associated protein [Anaerolineales bacterium]
MDSMNFDYEYLNETDQPDEPLRTETRTRLLKLAEGHDDLIGAAVSLEELTSSNTPHRYKARIVAYIRPENLAAVEKGDTAINALQAALNAIERQIRKKREKLRTRWKQP